MSSLVIHIKQTDNNKMANQKHYQAIMLIINTYLAVFFLFQAKKRKPIFWLPVNEIY